MGLKTVNKFRLFGVLILYSIAIYSVEANTSEVLTEWGSHKRMLMKLTHSIQQQARLSLPPEPIELHGEMLSAKNFVLEGATPLGLIQSLQRDYPVLNRLEFTGHRLVLSGLSGRTHCMLHVKQKQVLKQELMLSCAQLSADKAEIIIPHPDFKVIWSWHENNGKKSVYQQVIELVFVDKSVARNIVFTRLSELGWSLSQTKQGVIATKLNRYLILGFIEDDSKFLKAYLVETRNANKSITSSLP